MALECICLDKGPRVWHAARRRNCTVDAELQDLLAERIVLDWSNTAPSMRKVLNAANMEAKVRICWAFKKAKNTFKAMVDGQTLSMEWPAIHDKFKGQ